MTTSMAGQNITRPTLLHRRLQRLRAGAARVIDAVRTLHPGTRVLVCSGHLEEDVLRKRITAGAYAFLAKPYSGPELVRKVEEVLVGPAPAQLPGS
jgi:DNA-binding NtrC family response regulator